MPPRKFPAKQPMRQKPRTRNATVHFFRVFVDGQREPLKRLNVETAHALLSELTFEELPKSRYYKSSDGDVFMGISTLIGGRLRFAIGKQIRSPLYQEGEVFKVAPAPGTGTAKWIAPTYCVFFPDKSIVGAIFSAEGPRIDQVARYFEDGMKLSQKIDMEAIVRPDVLAELKRLKFVQKVQIKYVASTGPSLFRGLNPDTDSVMNGLAELQDGSIVTITVDAGKKDGASLRGLVEKLREMFVKNEFVVAPMKFSVSGPDLHTGARNVPINLLLSKIVATKKVPLVEGGKQLDQDAAFQAIEGAYAERLTEFPSIAIYDA